MSAVFRLVSICALTSAPASISTRTAATCPFIAAIISGEMPSLEPVLELISAPAFSNSLIQAVWPLEAARDSGV